MRVTGILCGSPHKIHVSLMLYGWAEIFRWRRLTRIVPDHESGIGPIELVRALPDDVRLAILKIGGLIPVDNQSAIIELIRNTDVAVAQLHRIGGQRSSIAVLGGIGKVLEHNLLVMPELDNPVVTRVSDQRLSIWQAAGKRDNVQPALSANLPHDFSPARNLDRPVEKSFGRLALRAG